MSSPSPSSSPTTAMAARRQEEKKETNYVKWILILIIILIILGTMFLFFKSFIKPSPVPGVNGNALRNNGRILNNRAR
jgi:hypothetical protein